MKLLIQPDDGVAPLVSAVRHAKKSVLIVVFRFDLKDLEQALGHAVERGVAVRALIANTNRGGEKRLRKLEQRLLAAGVQVARTGEDRCQREYGKNHAYASHWRRFRGCRICSMPSINLSARRLRCSLDLNAKLPSGADYSRRLRNL